MSMRMDEDGEEERPPLLEAEPVAPGEAGRRIVRGTAMERLEALGIDRICNIIRSGGTVADIARHARVGSGFVLLLISQRQEWYIPVTKARFDTATIWDEHATKVISDATDLFELAKAKELANHYRWRAAHLNKALYGDTSKVAVDVTVSEMSPEERRERIAALQAKLFGGPTLAISGKVEPGS